MDISAGLIAKGTAGALAAAATTAGVIYKDQLFGRDRSFEITKFDTGLIDFLKIKGGDIVFDVKKEKGGDFTASDLNLSAANPLPITVKVIVDTSNDTNLKQKTGNTDPKGKISTLQSLNGSDSNTAGTAWTWTCKIRLKVPNNDKSETPLDLNGKTIKDQDKIFKSDGGGLFGILKKSDANGTSNETKKVKEKFIRFCAKKRPVEKNKDLESGGIPSSDQNDLKSDITVNLELGNANAQNGKTDTNVLYPLDGEDERKFNKLFGEIKETTTTTVQ